MIPPMRLSWATTTEKKVVHATTTPHSAIMIAKRDAVRGGRSRSFMPSPTENISRCDKPRIMHFIVLSPKVLLLIFMTTLHYRQVHYYNTMAASAINQSPHCPACENTPCLCTSECCDQYAHPGNQFCTQCGVRNWAWHPMTALVANRLRRSSRAAYCLLCEMHCEHSCDKHCGVCGSKFLKFNFAPHYARFMAGSS